MKNKKYVITITRQFGSLGRPIAKLMAEQLGIEYYDRDIVDQAAKAVEASRFCCRRRRRKRKEDLQESVFQDGTSAWRWHEQYTG